MRIAVHIKVVFSYGMPKTTTTDIATCKDTQYF